MKGQTAVDSGRIEFWRFSSRNRAGHRPNPATLDRRNHILTLWAAGITKDIIAYIAHVDADTVSRHLRAGRKAGDARAVLRHPATIRMNLLKSAAVAPCQRNEIA